jgi:hypothetical protein
MLSHRGPTEEALGKSVARLPGDAGGRPGDVESSALRGLRGVGQGYLQFPVHRTTRCAQVT